MLPGFLMNTNISENVCYLIGNNCISSHLVITTKVHLSAVVEDEDGSGKCAHFEVTHGGLAANTCPPLVSSDYPHSHSKI